MSIQTTEVLKDVNVFTENQKVEIEVTHLGNGQSGTLKLLLVDTFRTEAYKLTIFGNDAFMQDLEHALSVYNQERTRQKSSPEIHAVSKNGVEVPA